MDARSGSHPTDAMLRAYAGGRLADSAARQLMEHLGQCAECGRRLASLSNDSSGGKVGDSGPADHPEGNPVAFKATPPAGVPKELAELTSYEVVRELGRGGMGVVYLARNKLMDRLEVLKMVNKAQVGRPEAIERFLQEIRTAARLIHPNVATAFSVHALGDLLVLAMEYVEGEDLAKVVRLRGALPVANACYYIYQAALGLQRGHESGMVHRDIKPGNLLLTKQGKRDVVKIVDFGLAKAKTEMPEDRDLTGTNQMMGTPGYTAPEQLLDAKSADIRADVYSLGCTLYCLLTGSRAFQGNSIYQVLLEQEKGLVPPLREYRPDLPDGLQEVVSRMMAKEPADRFQTPADLARALVPFFKTGLRESVLTAGESPAVRPTGETIGGQQPTDTLPPKEPGSRPPQSPVGSTAVAGRSPADSSAAAESAIVVCPRCAANLNVRAGLLGKRVKCKKCATVFVAIAGNGATREGEVLPPGERISRAETVPPGPRSAPPVTDLPTLTPNTSAGAQRPTELQERERLPVFEPEDPGGSRVGKWIVIAAAAVVVLAVAGLGTMFVVNPSFADRLRSSGGPATVSDSAKRQSDTTPPIPSASKANRRTDREAKQEPVAATRQEKAPPPDAPPPPAKPAPPAPAGPTKEQLAALRGMDLEACRNAFDAVATMRNDKARIATPALLEAVGHHSDPGLRTAIVDRLRQIGPPADKDFNCLEQALRLNYDPAKRYAIQQLEDMGGFDPAARAAVLVEGLKDSNSREIRIATEKALAKLGRPAKRDAFKPLLTAAADRDDDISRAAVDAIGNLGPLNSAEDLDVLLRSFNDSGARVEVRCFAVKKLGEMGKAADRAVPDLRRVLEDDRESKGTTLKSDTLAALTLIGNKDPATVKALAELVDSSRQESAVRLEALDALTKLDQSALSIVELLKLVVQQGPEQNKEVSDKAESLLDKRIESLRPNELTELLPLLKHKNTRFVLKALAAVGSKKQASGIAAEVANLTSPANEPSIRAAALDALESTGSALGADAKPVARKVLDSFNEKTTPEDEKLKLAFTIAAIQPGDAEVAKAIVPRLLDELQWHGRERPDEKVREKVVRILDAYGQPAVAEVVKRIDRILDGSGPHHPERVSSRRELYNVLAHMGNRLKSDENYQELDRLRTREQKSGNKDITLRDDLYKALGAMKPN
jgi:serine/threonine protein kinase